MCRRSNPQLLGSRLESATALDRRRSCERAPRQRGPAAGAPVWGRRSRPSSDAAPSRSPGPAGAAGRRRSAAAAGGMTALQPGGTPLEDLPLRRHTVLMLRAEGVLTLGELRAMHDDELLQ